MQFESTRRRNPRGRALTRAAAYQDIADRIPSVKQQAAEHRKHVLARFQPPGVIVVQGKKDTARNSDVMQPFRQDSNFAYLTGIQQPGFACAINSETGHFTLLAPKLDPQLVVWMGAQPSLEDLAEEYGADACAYIEDFDIFMASNHDGLSIYTLPEDAQSLQELTGKHSISGGLHSSKSNELLDAVSASRAVKTDADVACLRHASAVSAQAHMAMWRGCQAGMHEYELEAEFLRVTLGGGLRHTGYPSIVAAGRNAATLHYDQNNALVGKDELVLVDAGAEYRCFTADISRTFPVSGKFAAAQRDLYSAVLQVQAHAISLYQKGKGWKEEVIRPSRQLYCQLLLDLGLAKGSIDALLDNDIDKLFQPHGLGHFLGMDVHDVSPSGPVPEQLQAGHVVTCEPGLYFVDHMLQPAYEHPQKRGLLNQSVIDSYRPFGGIRIEDNILIQSQGNHNLTEAAGMVKSIEDVEAACKAGR